VWPYLVIVVNLFTCIYKESVIPSRLFDLVDFDDSPGAPAGLQLSAFSVKSSQASSISPPKPNRNIQYLLDHPTPPIYLRRTTGHYTNTHLERMDL
jgi:hypothetical protein